MTKGARDRVRATLKGLALIGGLVASTSATANEIDVFNEQSSEYTNCFAFFTLARRCAPRTATEGELSRNQELRKATADGAIMASKSAGMSDEALAARTKLAVETLAALITNDCVNFSVLIAKYGDACRLLLENPKERTQEIREGVNP